MNCNALAEHLSAYIDEELAAEEYQGLEHHLEQCASCRRLISEHRLIGSLMRSSEPAADAEMVWERVSTKLERPVTQVGSRESTWQGWNRIYIASALLAVAASILLLATLRYVGSENHQAENSVHDHHAVLAVDFAEVFRSAQLEPQKALAKLSAKYEGRELTTEDTLKYLGYEPALFRLVPEGFTRISTHVLNMPCCKCSATVCERSDGTSLIVFEHKDEQPLWFGDSPSIEQQCAGVPCRVVESAGQLAVSWKNQNRQMTLVGAEDMAEVNHWVACLKL